MRVAAIVKLWKYIHFIIHVKIYNFSTMNIGHELHVSMMVPIFICSRVYSILQPWPWLLDLCSLGRQELCRYSTRILGCWMRFIIITTTVKHKPHSHAVEVTGTYINHQITEVTKNLSAWFIDWTVSDSDTALQCISLLWTLITTVNIYMSLTLFWIDSVVGLRPVSVSGYVLL